MDVSHLRSLTEFQGMDDSGFIHQWPISYLDEFSSVTSTVPNSFEDSLYNSFSHQMFDFKPSLETANVDFNRPSKILKTNSWNSSITNHISIPQATTASSPNQVSFSNSNCATQFGILKPKDDSVTSKSISALPSNTIDFGNQYYVSKSCQGAKRISTNTSTNTNTNTRLPSNQEHILAERKRREKLSQRFIALSAVIPGLKKVDKASILGDAIKHVKQLQERVKTLEEQTKKKSIESVVFVKKIELYADGENSSSDENFSGSGSYEEPLPEIEARFCDKNVLIRIHCERRKCVLERTIAEIEKLNLSIVNSNVMSFGSCALDITIVAQMDADFTMTMKDFVKNLRSALKLFM